MPNFTKDQLHQVMGVPENIRNLSVIAHVDHGKSTLSDALVSAAGISNKKTAGEDRHTDTRADEAERGITIKSTGVSMYFNKQIGEEKKEYLINLVDSPGHVDFSSEVTAALRITDGALVVVDCIEGTCVQTETVLRQALQEKVKPVLFLNKCDRIFLELDLDYEETYIKFRNTIENVNAIIGSFDDKDLGNVMVDPLKDTVAFGSGYHQWAFTINDFAKMYGYEGEQKKYLWGDWYFNAEKKRWTNKNPENKFERGFCKLVLKPLKMLMKSIMNGQTEKYEKMFKKLGIKITSDERAEIKKDKHLVKMAMNKWLPASECLLNMFVTHLPSPKVAQKYRTKYLYQGDVEDEVGQDMMACNPDGHVMIYISKMIPVDVGSGRFYAFGRVFSGTVKAGIKYKIMGPAYEQGGKQDVYKGQAQQVISMMAAKANVMPDVPCGNTVALTGIDNYLLKTGTISSYEDAAGIRDMKFSVSPVVRRAVTVKKTADLPKLVQAIKNLSKSDPLVQITHDEDTGEIIVAGSGELHLEIILNDLRDFLKGAELIIKEPVVAYRETIIGSLDIPVLSKSPNKHNRLFVTIKPLSEELQEQIEEGKYIDKPKDAKAQVRSLVEEHGLEEITDKRLWTIGPNGSPNMFVDVTQGVQYLNEIKGSVITGFNHAAYSGPICGEPIRGVMFRLNDVTLHADAIHRGMGQILPTTRRVMLGSMLKAHPRLVQPMFLMTISVPLDFAGPIYGIISNRRGIIVDDAVQDNGIMKVIKAHLPVAESFGVDSELRAQTSGQAFSQCAFDHWAVIESDPLEEGSYAYEIAKKIRERKGLNKEPDADVYLDRL